MAKTIKTVMPKTKKRLTAPTPKSRDLLHLQEITHGSGAGFHKGKKAHLARDEKRAKEKGYTDENR
jgi:hypothetical protein